MDVLATVLGLVVAGVVLAALWHVALLLFWWVQMAWPALAGIIGGIWLWSASHDNAGAAIAIVGVIGQWPWFVWFDKRYGGVGSITPTGMYGKTKMYDKDGNVSGYVDKD